MVEEIGASKSFLDIVDIETNEYSGTKDDAIAVDCLAKYGAGKEVKNSGLGFSKADEIAFDCFSECVEAVVDTLADAGGIEKEEVAFDCFSITGATEKAEWIRMN